VAQFARFNQFNRIKLFTRFIRLTQFTRFNRFNQFNRFNRFNRFTHYSTQIQFTAFSGKQVNPKLVISLRSCFCFCFYSPFKLSCLAHIMSVLILSSLISSKVKKLFYIENFCPVEPILLISPSFPPPPIKKSPYGPTWPKIVNDLFSKLFA
jgi:hypothetical protein